MNTLNFTIDAKLIRELGERLVGKPSIALGELIKNSYDADSTKAKIRFERSDRGIITISDDGQGMNFEEFKSYWMRIGTTHKEGWHRSPKFKRILTGQKGIGRLSVQFLADEMELITVSEKNLNKRLRAFIRWEDAIKAGDLIKATVKYEIEDGDFQQGTTIKLINLIHDWSENDFKELARDIWILSPPFKAFKTEHGNFDIDIISTEKIIEKIFSKQMKAFLNAYEGKIVGKNINGNVKVSLTHKGWEQANYDYKIADIPGVQMEKGKELKNGEFEIRIYRLLGHQPYGILVDDLRDYMEDFHGVHIYDAGFHLPYYGQKHGEWLGTSDEQARRVAVSDILPSEYQVDNGLTHLPGLRRTLGVVKINTSEELGLEIAISRDRLVDTKTFRALREMIRYALHLYAMEIGKHKIPKMIIQAMPSNRIETVNQVLEKYHEEIPNPIYEDLKKNIENAIESSDKRESLYRDKISFLGTFATAGISSLAYHHEIQKQLRTISDVSEDIKTMITDKRINEEKLKNIALELSEWVEKAKQLEALFSYYGDAETIMESDYYSAKNVLDEIIKQLSWFLRGVEINNNIPENVKLPKATLAEWGAIFQNVILNAYNAISVSENKEKGVIGISYIEDKIEKSILVQDNGIGVDIENSEDLFKPFERKIKLSDSIKALGYGGNGIGLTIVRLISERIGCRAIFTQPIKDYKTTFKLFWRGEK
ncbi:MAG: ATP-binding protein [Candidatus Aenigmarchaeota archaeon]|nr:ATP-binding protein [Candidatus Aenigmarchaeota archaeon]